MLRKHVNFGGKIIHFGGQIANWRIFQPELFLQRKLLVLKKRKRKQFAIACGQACAIVAPRQTASTDFIVRKCCLHNQKIVRKHCRLLVYSKIALGQILGCNLQG